MNPPVTTDALVEALIACLEENDHRSRYQQALALLSGPLVPIITDAAEARAALQQVTAERDEAREVVARCNNSFGSYSYHLNPHPAEQIEKVKWQARSEWQRAEAATAELARLRAEGEALREDAARLDFLDGCNARLNASYGTHYGWKLVLNHNVNRLVLGDMKVDLHDSEGGNDKLPSCRLAIDEARKRTALARAATAREG